MLAEDFTYNPVLRPDVAISKTESLLQVYIADLLADVEFFVEDLQDIDLVPVESKGLTSPVQESISEKESLEKESLEKESLEKESLEKEFQCLLFQIGQIKMAIKLTCLSRIQVLDHVTPLVGSSTIYFGLMQSLGQQVRVVDSQRLLMPERYDEKLAKNCSHVIIMDREGGEETWGLAVNSVDQSIVIKHEAVQWRHADSKRSPWMAGIIREQMCVLLDTEQIDKILT